jgi:hypothetical protein
MRGSVKYLPSVFLGLVVLGISLPAAAQDVPMIEVSGGYNYLRATIPVFSGRDVPPASSNTVSFPNGWYADLAINTPQPKKMLAIVGQVSRSVKTVAGRQANQHAFMGGVRLNSRAIQRTVLFAQFLAGGTDSKFGNVPPDVVARGLDEWTVFYTMQIGGGVSVMTSKRAGIRLGADYLHVQGKHDSTVLNKNFSMIRVAAGIVLPFGTR